MQTEQHEALAGDDNHAFRAGRDKRRPWRHLCPPFRPHRGPDGGGGGQFVLWAFRQRLADGAAASPGLVQGFRLAFGLGGLEAAVAAFEQIFHTLAAHLRRDLGLCPLRCACVSVDEEIVVRLVAAAQLGDEALLWEIGADLVETPARTALGEHARAFAALLGRAELKVQEPAIPTPVLH